jgi:hypothetical protein
MTKKKKPEGELIPADNKPQWLVVSTEPDIAGRQLHRLLYGKARQAFGRTPGDLRRFREIAEFCNARGLEPREKVQCLADDNLPVPPKRKPGASDENEPAVEPIHGKV